MRTKATIITLALFTALATTTVSAATPTPAQILGNVQKKYRSLRSLEVSGTKLGSISVDGKKQSKSAKLHVIYQRPGKLRYEMGEGRDKVLVVSNGKNIYLYQASAKHYRRDPIKGEKELLARLAGPGASTLALLGGKDFTKTANQLKTVGNARISGTDCYIIQFALDKKGSAVQKLWVGKKDWFVRKNEIVVTTSTSQKQGDKKRTARVVQTDSTTLSSVRANPSVKTSAFTFTPPKGVTLFDQKQAEQQLQKNMQKQMQQQVNQLQQAADKLHGKPAPAVTVKDIQGNTRTLSSMKGDVVILSFWASRHKASGKYMEMLQRIYKSNHSKGLEILAVSIDKSESDVKSFVSKHKITFPTATTDLENIQRIGKAYSVGGLPTTYIIDRSGAVKSHFFGVPGEDVIRAALKKAGL